MTTPSNRELEELIHLLEERVRKLEIENEAKDRELEEIVSRQNRIVQNSIGKAEWNEGLFILKHIDALNDVDLRRALL